MSFSRYSVLAVLAMLFSYIGSVTKGEAGSAPGAEAEWANTVAAAKKEGKVVVFLYHRENIETAIRVFEKAFPGIQLVTASTSADVSFTIFPSWESGF